MPKLKDGDVPLTPEEDAAVRAGIAADPDAFELDDEWFANARPATEVHPELAEDRKRVVSDARPA